MVFPTMQTLTLASDQPFSLDQSLSCGQVFRWKKEGSGWWYGVVGDRVIKIRQVFDRLIFEGAPGRFIRHYFSLDLDLLSILDSIDNDPAIQLAIRHCSGLRIVRQPPWECTISYICSTNSNIPTISRRIASIAAIFGEKIEFEGISYHRFPTPSSIAGECERLKECRLGYRYPYVIDTALAIADDPGWEKKVRHLPYEAARKELMKLRGVGPKAADCILLFAFEKYEAFPVDVWIRRIMKQHYLPDLTAGAPLTGREYETIRSFARNHFGDYCGYAQEYLYASRGEQT
jgi:N-glycosylase/DNA lyase